MKSFLPSSQALHILGPRLLTRYVKLLVPFDPGHKHFNRQRIGDYPLNKHCSRPLHPRPVARIFPDPMPLAKLGICERGIDKEDVNFWASISVSSPSG